MGSNALGKIERPQDRRRVEKRREDGQNAEDVQLGYAEELRWVHVIPVSELVS